MTMKHGLLPEDRPQDHGAVREASTVASLLDVLGDATRLAILRHLHGGEHRVVELTEHLGYEKGEPTTSARGNARNGTTTKTIDSPGGPLRDQWCPGTGPGPSPRVWCARVSAVWTAWMRVNHQA